MIRAYDEYGNVVDLVEWEKQIRAEEKTKVLDALTKIVCKYYTMQERAGYYADTNNMIKQRIVDFAEQLKGEAYKQGRETAIDELSDLIDRLLWEYDMETYKDLSESFKESARLLKEQK